MCYLEAAVLAHSGLTTWGKQPAGSELCVMPLRHALYTAGTSTLSVKGQINNISDFKSRTASVELTTQPYLCSAKAAIDRTKWIVLPVFQ